MGHGDHTDNRSPIPHRDGLWEVNERQLKTVQGEEGGYTEVYKKFVHLCGGETKSQGEYEKEGEKGKT